MIAEMIGRELEWTQPSAWKMQYEMRADAELIATLRFRSSFGTFATAESADGCWTFKRIGFWQTKATIRTCESDTEIAIFKNNTWSGGGTLEFADRRKLLASTNGWRTTFEIKSESGNTLVRFKCQGLLHQSAKVEIQPEAAVLQELPWIVMLGWYLTIMMYMDAATAAAV